MEPTEYDILPQLYYRLSKPLKEGVKLPMVDLSKLFTVEENYKFDVQTFAYKQHFNHK